MSTLDTTILSPIDNRIVAQRTQASISDIQQTVENARHAQTYWQSVAIADRATVCHRAVKMMLRHETDIAKEITLQMGRPIQYAAAELQVMQQRATYMINIAQQSLSDIILDQQQTQTNTQRYIQRVPVGVVVVIAAWNYPYLTAINCIIPAIMAGNCVILKHSNQTLLCAERFQQAFDDADLHQSVFQYLHLDHAGTDLLASHAEVNFVSFTGSNTGGKTIEQCIAGHFKGLTLELGGKDPAYVREDITQDVALDKLVEDIKDGVFFNCGQSCCAIERIYVHHSLYFRFVERFVESVKHYRLANPLLPDTTLGPMINSQAANRVREQIAQAVAAGASCCIDSQHFKTQQYSAAYLAPQVLIDVNHSMSIMQQESFAPVVGIMQVRDDQHAIELMNDSAYGLTASIWTNDVAQTKKIGEQLQTGTVFMNRCDYLDPGLAWSGVKQSGRGYSLSTLAYQQLTRTRSFYLQL